MKKFFLLPIWCSLLPVFAFSQAKGTIYYTETLKTSAKPNTTQKVLYFNTHVSMYEALEKVNTENRAASGFIRYTNASESIWTNTRRSSRRLMRPYYRTNVYGESSYYSYYETGVIANSLEGPLIYSQRNQRFIEPTLHNASFTTPYSIRQGKYHSPMQSLQVYRNLSKTKLLHKVEWENGEYLLQENYPYFDWQIGEETKTILGYVCKKATVTFNNTPVTNENPITYTAWFAPEIETHFAPGLVGGLPGAILRFESDLLDYEATEVKLNEVNRRKLVEPTQGMSMTRRAFNAMASHQ